MVRAKSWMPFEASFEPVPAERYGRRGTRRRLTTNTDAGIPADQNKGRHNGCQADGRALRAAASSG